MHSCICKCVRDALSGVLLGDEAPRDERGSLFGCIPSGIAARCLSRYPSHLRIYSPRRKKCHTIVSCRFAQIHESSQCSIMERPRSDAGAVRLIGAVVGPYFASVHQPDRCLI